MDYINASLVEVPAARRRYILTQGPLPNTTGHFWLLVWEQRSRAIVMLNKTIEKNQVRRALVGADLPVRILPEFYRILPEFQLACQILFLALVRLGQAGMECHRRDTCGRGVEAQFCEVS